MCLTGGEKKLLSGRHHLSLADSTNDKNRTDKQSDRETDNRIDRQSNKFSNKCDLLMVYVRNIQTDVLTGLLPIYLVYRLYLPRAIEDAEQVRFPTA